MKTTISGARLLQAVPPGKQADFMWRMFFAVIGLWLAPYKKTGSVTFLGMPYPDTVYFDIPFQGAVVSAPLGISDSDYTAKSQALIDALQADLSPVQILGTGIVTAPMSNFSSIATQCGTQIEVVAYAAMITLMGSPSLQALLNQDMPQVIQCLTANIPALQTIVTQGLIAIDVDDGQHPVTTPSPTPTPGSIATGVTSGLGSYLPLAGIGAAVWWFFLRKRG